MEDRSQPPGRAAPDIAVRQFREILVWPVQLTNTGDAPIRQYCEQLTAAESPWCEAAGAIDGDGPDFRQRHYSEFTAFMPDVQRFLYGEGDTRRGTGAQGASPIRVFRRRDIAAVQVRLRPGEPSLTFEVARTELYFFYDLDLAILAFEVSGSDLTLSQAQDMLFRFGRAYPTAWDAEGSGAHCCDRIEFLDTRHRVLAASDYADREVYLDFVAAHHAPRVAAHWAFLLEPLVLGDGSSESGTPYRLLEHQRIPFLAFLAVDDPCAIGRNDWMRLAFAAAPGRADRAPFAPAFAAGFEAGLCYDRFWDPAGRHDQTTTRVLCSGPVFVMVGEAENARFTGAETGILAQFRHQYFLLGLIAHFHRAALLIFRDRLVTAISELSDYSGETVRRFKRAIRETHENFLRFTHRYWFQEVSSQAPARDLFARWVDHLGTNRLFREVREEVLDMIAYLDSDGLRRQANTVVRLTVVTFFGLIGSTATGFLGMNLFDWTLLSVPAKILYFLAVLLPIAVLTFYTAAKSQRLIQFLEAMSDERRNARDKAKAFARVWQRRR